MTHHLSFQVIIRLERRESGAAFEKVAVVPCLRLVQTNLVLIRMQCLERDWKTVRLQEKTT